MVFKANSFTLRLNQHQIQIMDENKAGNDEAARLASVASSSTPVEASLSDQVSDSTSKESSKRTTADSPGADLPSKKSRESETAEPANHPETDRIVAVIAFRQNQVSLPSSVPGIASDTKRRLLVLQWIDEDRAAKSVLKYCEDRIRVKQGDRTSGITTGGLLSGEDFQTDSFEGLIARAAQSRSVAVGAPV
jgi:hypothetical protein